MSRSGFVALAGRPNVGKSTFVNAAVGEKVAITSDRPQTTRRAIRGVCTRDETEIVLVDLPGVQRPRDAMTARMARRVSQELAGADASLLLLDAERGVGPGDRFIARTLAEGGAPVVIAANKVDRLSRAATVEVLARAAELGDGWEVFAISARTGAGLEPLLGHLGSLMPEGPFMYGTDARSDQPTELLIAELVREAVVVRTFQELPHAVEVLIEEVEEPRAAFVRVRALLWVETESQKRIVIGAGGRMIRAIGTAARKELERALAAKVHLDLTVRVRPRWRTDDALLDRLGIT
jgi:GTPase